MVRIGKIYNAALEIGLGVKKWTKPQNIEELRYVVAPNIDSLNIKNKTALSEFKSYLEGFKLNGESYVPISQNPQSSFMEYYNYRKEICVPKPAVKLGGLTFPARPAPQKIINKNETADDCLISLINFSKFLKDSSKYATKEEYYQIIDEISIKMPDYVRKMYPDLRPEVIENSGKIFKWRSMMDVEKKVDGKIVKNKFYDETKKMEAIEDFSKFVEKLTGKKVLIASPYRMTIAPDELGLLNDPKSYENVDYILFGHGTGSSLITDSSKEGHWIFSDTGESVWEYIEKNVPKGKKILVGTCEQDKYWRADGMIPKQRKEMKEMYDKSGNYMYGIGNSVSAAFGISQPAKICESGKRHIVGHTYIENYNDISSFIDGCYGKVKNVEYDL